MQQPCTTRQGWRRHLSLLRWSRAGLLLLPCLLLVVAGVRHDAEAHTLLWLGALFQALACLLMLASGRGWSEPLGAPGTEAFTAGMFVGDEHIGNVIFFVVPGALMPPEIEIAAADFPDADALADDGHANPLSLLRGVEMRVTA